MSIDLTGASILVSRPDGSAQRWLDGFASIGAEVIHQPGLDLEPTDHTEPSLAALRDLEPDCALVLTSPAAVRHALGREELKDHWPDGLCWTVGQQSARLLLAAGCRNVRSPKNGFGADALLADPRFPAAHQVRILCARDGRKNLRDALAERRLDVANVYVYQRQPAALRRAAKEALADLNRRPNSKLVVTATSIAVLERLCVLFPDQLFDRPLVVVGPRIAQRAGELGFQRIVTAIEPGLASVIQAVAMALEW